ncbi:hypothetical protein Pelo_5793 [Pelomyxa schiedti]|nr:hypothetical protein Pelo_5793 [Pelomyxa schiedti]
MMLRVFPEMSIVKEHFLRLGTATPAMAQFTMQMFPDITTDWIAESWSHVPQVLSVRLWLGDAILRPNPARSWSGPITVLQRKKINA